MIEIIPLAGVGEVVPDADLPAILAAAFSEAGFAARCDDVLVITQKIVSKAEGRFVDLNSVEPGPEAQKLAEITQKDPRFVELVLSEAVAVVRAAPNVLVTRHRCGHVMANSGIDQSNIGPGEPGRVLLLPWDADASARCLREALRHHWGEVPAVLIADSFGRPWRNGVVGVAIGASGLPALLDRRGAADRDGRKLEVTQVGLGDMIASAASLAMGEAEESVPAVLVRGVRWEEQAAPASALIRPRSKDLFQ